MQPPRVLDLDLDFFLHDTAHWSPEGRLDPAEYPPWDIDQAISFLREQCHLEAPLPGCVVENHGELFTLWRKAVQDGRLTAPFHVTHIDAHADLGLGDAGYMHLMTEVLYREPEERLEPSEGLGDGNYLAFAIACRWISDLVYVYNDRGGNDLMTYHLEGFHPDASHIQLKAMRKSEIEKLWHLAPKEDLQVDRHEPLVPFSHRSWRDFHADRPFDFICLARSPSYTPAEADPIFDEIRRLFINEAPW
jgi:hypothetical protein